MISDVIERRYDAERNGQRYTSKRTTVAVVLKERVVRDWEMQGKGSEMSKTKQDLSKI